MSEAEQVERPIKFCEFKWRYNEDSGSHDIGEVKLALNGVYVRVLVYDNACEFAGDPDSYPSPFRGSEDVTRDDLKEAAAGVVKKLEDAGLSKMVDQTPDYGGENDG